MGDVGERELLAIIFTDAVGSTSQTAQDEDKSLSMLMADLDFIRNESRVRGGSVLKNTGDGLLISFKSAVDAVECALAIQKSFRSRPKGSGFQHKIGVHIGDVIKKDGDIYGAGVNTASRLVDQCAPGGICLSSTLFELTKQKSEIGKLELKDFLLENSDPPVLAYQTRGFGVPLEPTFGTRQTPGHSKPKKYQKLVWIMLGLVGTTLLVGGFWYFAKAKQEKPKAAQLFGFEFRPGTIKNLISADGGRRIDWTLENNTDQNLELRWFDCDGRPRVHDNLKGELSDLGPGKTFRGITYRGHVFGVFDPKSQLPLGSLRFLSGERLSLVAEKDQGQVYLEPKYLRKAMAGDSLAQAQLSEAFWSGRGLPQNNEEAARWAKMSFERGNSFGLCMYAACLDMGAGVPQNSDLALSLWRRAADAGEGWAYARLGDRYLNGYGGVAKDYQAALPLLERASEKGNHWAMVNLGRCYEQGLGISVDLNHAEELYRKAAENPDCKEAREALEKFMQKRGQKGNPSSAIAPTN